MKKSLTQLLCQGLIGILLFMQMTVAAYACAGLTGVQEIGPTHPAKWQTTYADFHARAGIDQAAPNLCIAHCQSGHQGVGHFQAPPVHLAVPSGFYVLPQVLPAFVVGRVHPPSSSDLHRAAFMPHAILHCCFRF